MRSKIKFVIIVFALILSNCIVSFQLIGTQRPSIAIQEVLEYSEIPYNAEKIGYVTVTGGSSFDDNGANSQIEKKAAEVGANGYTIISEEKTAGFINNLGQTTSGAPRVKAIVFFMDNSKPF